MRRSITPLAVMAALSLLSAAGLEAQQKSDDSFKWTGMVASGKTLQIRNVNGDVRVTGATGREVIVTAVRRAKKSDPTSVEIRVEQESDGVSICAVWPSEQDGSGCSERSSHGKKWDRNDVSVEFSVQVPEGVKFEGQTVNGSVSASGLTTDAEVTSVNGDVSLATRGTGSAETVNGDVMLRLGATNWTGDVEAKTVNGSVTVEMPTPSNLEVVANTMNGEISSEFPLTLQGKISRQRMRGTIGNGGPRLELSTVNGAIELKKAN